MNVILKLYRRMGTQNGHNVPFLEFASLKKRKRKAMKRIKHIDKYLKRVTEKKRKKKSRLLVPKVVIDLPFEGMKVEGSQKYRRKYLCARHCCRCTNRCNLVSESSNITE